VKSDENTRPGQPQDVRREASGIVEKAKGDRRLKIRGRFSKALGVFQVSMGEAWQDIKDDSKIN
jgi:hypothetical protein